MKKYVLSVDNDTFFVFEAKNDNDAEIMAIYDIALGIAENNRYRSKKVLITREDIKDAINEWRHGGTYSMSEVAQGNIIRPDKKYYEHIKHALGGGEEEDWED